MKHTNFYFILVLFSLIGLPLSAEEQLVVEQQKVTTVSLSSTQRFGEYLGVIAQVLEAATDESGENAEYIQERKAFIQKHVARTTSLMARIDELFVRGAFGQKPSLKAKFYAIFNNIDMQEWPIRAVVRSLSKSIELYKKIICSSSLFAQGLDREVLDAINALYDELSLVILTDDFFEFTTLESFIDNCFSRPVEFVKAHPYVTAGVIVVLVAAGGLTYYYLTKKSALQEYLESQNAQLIIGSQKDADCGVKALYATWCTQQANGDLEAYKELFCDNARYERFKATTSQFIQAGVIAGADFHPPRDANNPTDWLENDHIAYLQDQFNAAQREGHEFGFSNNTLHFVRSRDEIDQGAVAGDLYYRDLELRRPDGDEIIYSADTLPAGRVAHCEEIRRGGLRQNMQPSIEQFRAQPGNKFSFIVNNQYITAAHRAAAQQAMIEGRNPEPAVGGHFFHVRAISDPSAAEGVGFVITETSEPRVGTIDQVLTSLRSLLRPF